MEKLSPVGRLFIVIAMVAFGVQHLVYRDFVTRVVPTLPLWIPGHSILASVFGVFLIAAGLAIIFGIAARRVALVLGAVIFLSFALLHVPLLLADIGNGGLMTRTGKGLVMSGGAFLVAGSLGTDAGRGALWRFLGRFIPLSRFFFAAFLVLCGILHFVYVEFVKDLVPAWIPGHVFWTYFAGVALIAGGLGIAVPWTTRLAASLTALMIFSWVFLLHIPRALADLHNSNETTAVFEALAMAGIAILIAAEASASRRG